MSKKFVSVAFVVIFVWVFLLIFSCQKKLDTSTVALRQEDALAIPVQDVFRPFEVDLTTKYVKEDSAKKAKEWEIETFLGKFLVVDFSDKEMFQLPNGNWVLVKPIFGNIEKVIQINEKVYFVSTEYIFEFVLPSKIVAVCLNTEANFNDLTTITGLVTFSSHQAGHGFVLKGINDKGKVIAVYSRDPFVKDDPIGPIY
jgi:hypothetical protein